MSRSRTTAPAVLFDIDGTLVDSNYLHVHAWHRAFTEVGIPVEAWRIHRSIGLDGTTLVSTLADGADDDRREHVKDLHSRYYKEMTPELRRLPGARALLEVVHHKLDLQIVLATSAPEDELSILCEVLDSDDLVSAVTPSSIEVALDRAGVPAAHAVFVGDAVSDVLACRRAGLETVALLSGGVSQAELENAGAARVFADPLELCQHLDDTPIAALANIVGAR